MAEALQRLSFERIVESTGFCLLVAVIHLTCLLLLFDIDSWDQILQLLLRQVNLALVARKNLAFAKFALNFIDSCLATYIHVVLAQALEQATWLKTIDLEDLLDLSGKRSFTSVFPLLSLLILARIGHFYQSRISFLVLTAKVVLRSE